MKFPMLFGFLIQRILVINAEFVRPSLSSECQVEGVLAVYANETVLVSWAAVSSSCSTNPDYKVEYYVNDKIKDTIDSAAPHLPLAQILTGRLTCEKVAIKVMVYEEGNLIGESEKITLDRKLDDIVDVSAEQTDNGLLIKWEHLELGDSCPVTYYIQYDVEGNDPAKTNTTTNNFFLIPVAVATSCTAYHVRLVASSNEMESNIVDTTFEIGIPAVTDVSLKNDKGKVVLKYKPPNNIPAKCGEIAYSVVQEDYPCFRSDFSIAPVSTNGNEGAVTQASIVREPGPVQNLVATQKADKVYLEWEAPVGGIGCEIAYFIHYDGKTATSRITSFSAPLQLEACKTDTVSVTALIIINQDYVEGSDTELRLVGELGPVTQLECSLASGTIECSWEKPSNVENCEKISYRVSYGDGINNNTAEIDDTTFKFKVAARICSYWFGVVPIGHVGKESQEGEKLEGQIEGCD